MGTYTYLSKYATDADFGVWVGCLACYNEGRLTGEWVDASDCVGFVPCTREGHEEWWVMDHEAGSLIPGGCSPNEAYETYEHVVWLLSSSVPLEAIKAYLDNVGGSVRDLSATQLEDAYRGEYESWREYTDSMADETMLTGVSDTVAMYFDYQKWADDLEMDHNYTRNSKGMVYVFQDV